MWDLMLTGNYTPQKIREIANEQWGFRTKRYKSKGGCKIPMWGIYTMFNNIFYTGMFRWKGALFSGNHKAMVTIEEFDKVQELLGNKSNKRPQQHSFSYTALIRCESCYMMFTATEKQKLTLSTGKRKKYVYIIVAAKARYYDVTIVQ